jgi:hypothetical protein
MDMKPNLESDLFNSNYIVEKCKNTTYAQHLYAALCNNVFIKDGHQWTCSWRYSGGIIAELRNCGEDYIDWYCSGISDRTDLMREGCVSEEVRKDINDLGWIIEDNNCEDDLIENI